MFTGIVEEVGKVSSRARGRLAVKARVALEGTRVGDSISVNGACLTVVKISGSELSFNVVPETLSRTSLGDLHPGDTVNLERALTLSSRLGGHIVQGHVEGTATLSKIKPQRLGHIAWFDAPPDLMRYIVSKGFVALDGVSLTVVKVENSSFSVALIPHTLKSTNLGGKKEGARVNLETDILARYAERLSAKEESRVSWDLLAEQGFIRRKEG